MKYIVVFIVFSFFQCNAMGNDVDTALEAMEAGQLTDGRIIEVENFLELFKTDGLFQPEDINRIRVQLQEMDPNAYNALITSQQYNKRSGMKRRGKGFLGGIIGNGPDTRNGELEAFYLLKDLHRMARERVEEANREAEENRRELEAENKKVSSRNKVLVFLGAALVGSGVFNLYDL